MSMRRSRGRGGSNTGNGGSSSVSGGNGGGGNRRPGGVPNRHQMFDSNGPEVRIRGNAWQVHEKYLAMARDAQSAGDRVAMENYLQHAEHYYRIILAIQEASGELYSQRPTAPQTGEGEQPQPYMETEQPSVLADPTPPADEAEVTSTRQAAIA